MGRKIIDTTAKGIGYLNDMIEDQLPPGGIFLIGGMPGSGKTTLAVDMSLCAAMRRDKKVMLYSMEMKMYEMARIMHYCAQTNKEKYEYYANSSNGPFPHGNIRNYGFTHLTRNITVIEQVPTPTFERLGDIAMLLKADLLVIDYLQLLDVGRRGGMFPSVSRHVEIIRNIKSICMELKMAALILFQTKYNSSSMKFLPDKLEEHLDIIGFLKKRKDSKAEYGILSLMKNRWGDIGEFVVPFNRTGKYIDFGTLGLKIGDEICFNPTGEIFHVGSGNGTPGNGGTIIRTSEPDPDGCRNFSIRAITRRLRNGDLPHDLDVYKLWTFEGKTLREIYEKIPPYPTPG